jgi:hypothetical protein
MDYGVSIGLSVAVNLTISLLVAATVYVYKRYCGRGNAPIAFADEGVPLTAVSDVQVRFVTGLLNPHYRDPGDTGGT